MHFSPYQWFKHELSKDLTLAPIPRPMEFSIKVHTIKSGGSIVIFDGSQVIMAKNVFLFLKICLVLANIADPDEIHLGLHCLQKYPFRGFSLLRLTGPGSAVGNVSGNRCECDCRSRGLEFDPGPVQYFRGDWSRNNFYGHSSPFRWIIQEGLFSYKQKYVHKVLVNCLFKLAQEKVWLGELTVPLWP